MIKEIFKEINKKKPSSNKNEKEINNKKPSSNKNDNNNEKEKIKVPSVFLFKKLYYRLYKDNSNKKKNSNIKRYDYNKSINDNINNINNHN